MRFSFVLYAACYVAVEIVGHQLSLVGWPQVTPLMVATAVTDALLLVAVCVAALVTVDLTRPRWQPALAAWVRARTAGSGLDRPDDGTIEVTSWRSEPLALPAPDPGGTAGSTYAGGTYASSSTARPARPFPEDDGRLL